ncbi:MAG: response regulator [Blastocatellia bacterium]
MAFVTNELNSETATGAPPIIRLLVVDDEESVAFTVSEVLRLDGFVVDTALSGDEAVERLRDRQYDLVLTDLHMEGGDGLSVLAEVKRTSPLTIAIVLTGFASLESAIAAMRQGAYDYLVKPCIIDDMKHTIQRGLEHRRLMLAEQDARANLELLNRELERRVEERTAELQRVNEELARANNVKDVFFATLSHELRTPLTPILGWTKLLRSSTAHTGLLEQGLETIERNARLQTRLIDDLLDISRIVSDKLHFDNEPTDLGKLVEMAVETVRINATEREIELRASIKGAPLIVQGAPVRLQQVIWNLLSNAVKFTDKGGSILVEADQVNGEARVVVTDTGQGIAPEFLPHVFDPFRQADGSTTRQHGGLGLGLAIVRKLVELHGGWVRAESKGLQEGARFTFALPLAAIETAAHKDELQAQPGKLPEPVLIVEDSLDTLEMMRIFFAQYGCRVMVADSAREALRLAAIETPRIIISDIGMPDADGYELLAQLRRLPGMEAVPAIALSGYAMEEDTIRSIAAGFSHHLAKPIDPEKLIEIIRRLTA